MLSIKFIHLFMVLLFITNLQAVHAVGDGFKSETTSSLMGHRQDNNDLMPFFKDLGIHIHLE